MDEPPMSLKIILFNILRRSLKKVNQGNPVFFLKTRSFPAFINGAGVRGQRTGGRGRGQGFKRKAWKVRP
jgi:hypothetical protein